MKIEGHKIALTKKPLLGYFMCDEKSDAYCAVFIRGIWVKPFRRDVVDSAFLQPSHSPDFCLANGFMAPFTLGVASKSKRSSTVVKLRHPEFFAFAAKSDGPSEGITLKNDGFTLF